MRTAHPILRLSIELVAILALAETTAQILTPIAASTMPPILGVMMHALLLIAICVPLCIWRARVSRLLRAAGHRASFSLSTVRTWTPTRTWGLTAGVAITGFIITLILFYHAELEINQRALAQFESSSERLCAETVRRVDRVAYGLKGARGVYAASNSLDRAKFEAYVNSRDLPSEFPGALGFGLIERVQRTDLDAFIARERADGAADFHVWGLAEPDSPMANQQDLWVVTHCFPRQVNRSVWGLDIGTDPARRDAARIAALTGNPTITAATKPVQDKMNRSGFLYFVPVYQHDSRPATPEQRMANLVGLLYAPIVLEEALAGIPQTTNGDVDFEVFDGEIADPSTIIFDLDGHLKSLKTRVSAADFAERKFFNTSQTKVGGRTWTFTTSSTPKFEANIDHSTSRTIGFGGVAITILAAACCFAMLSSRQRAVNLARGMTAELDAAKRRAESALHEMGAFRTALDQHAIISITDRSGKIIDVNQAFCAISGYSAEELLGRNHRIINSGRQSQAYWDEFWKTILAGRVWRGEVCNRAKNGALYWVESLVAPFVGSDGQIERFVSIQNDVTQRVDAQRRLAESESAFRALAESSPIFVWTSDAEGRRNFFNRTWLDFRGRTLEEERDGGWREGVHPDDLPQLDKNLADAIVRKSGFEFEYRLRRHDGVYRTILSRGALRKDSSGQLTGFVAACMDLTEMREVHRQSEAANRAKSEFLANMSHEIRTPLTAILGFAELLEHDDPHTIDPEQRHQAVATIRNAGQHLLLVINDILDLSKIEADRLVVERIDTSLTAVLGEVIDLNRSRTEQKGVGLSIHLETAIPDRLLTDQTRLRQILLNLLGNAIKFTDAGTITLTVRAETAAEPPRLTIDIRDTGEGMTPEQAARLFRVFSQADASVTRRHGGTGLGLTISRRLAHLLGGDVMLLQTEIGKGSTFRFVLPLDVPPDAKWVDRLAPRPSHALPGRKVTETVPGRVLLAEDGIDNQRLIGLMLRKAGATVDIADNGRIAYEMIEKAEALGMPYDLLLTDMQMPEMDGYTLAQTLRSKGAAIPIVALTAHAMAGDRERCLESGCDDYVTKPIDRPALVNICAKWIGKTSSKRSAPQQSPSAYRPSPKERTEQRSRSVAAPTPL